MAAMAQALPLTVPYTAAEFARPIGVQCDQANAGGARLVNRCAVRIANDREGSRRTVCSSSCGLQLATSVSRSVRNEQLAWRGSSHFLGLDGYKISSRIILHTQRKLVREALRIAAENFDPKKIDANNVLTTLVKLGKQGLEAGTKLVPDTVPRPVAQLGVGVAGLLLGSFVIRSLFSTVFFILAIGGLGYFAFLFLTKGEGGSSSGSNFDSSSGKPKSTDEALEEARKIMDKYK